MTCSPNDIEDRYPPTALQQGMLFHALKAPGSGVDIEQMICTLGEQVNASRLREAWERIVARHAILRTAFDWDSEPMQRVQREVTLEWREEDWSGLASDDVHERLEEFLHADRMREFAMDAAPLMRFALLRLGERDWRLIWTFHHALLDGRCFPIVLREVFGKYEALCRGEERQLPEPRPYRAHIEALQAMQPAQSEGYWRQLLAGFSEPTPIVVEGLPGRTTEHRQADRDVVLDADTTQHLASIAAEHSVTLNTIVQGAWAILLSRYSGESDVVFGATRACRRSTVEGADEILGLFINTLPVRVEVRDDADLGDWLQKLRAQWVAMRPHEHTPLSMVQGWSNVPSGRLLFDSIVVFENYDLDAAMRVLGGVWEHRHFRLRELTNFALTLAVYSGTQLTLRIEFDRKRFAPEVIERLLGHLACILRGIASRNAAKLGDLPMLTEAERRQLLEEWNPRTATDRGEATLHELFKVQATRSPEAVALSCDGQTMTYGELDRRSTLLAEHLISLGVTRETIVGLCMERQNDLIVGLLAILKAGGAYLPIDLAYPPERLAFMLEDARCPVLLTQRALVPTLPEHQAQIVCIDEFTFEGTPKIGSLTPSGPDDLAYVIYTSGSTGKPKGALITHRNVVRLFRNTDHWFGFGATDVWTMFHSVAFDFSVWEIWGALLYGGRLVMIPHRVSRSPDAFHDLLVKEKVTVLNQTPSAFRQLVAVDSAQPRKAEFALRYVIFGGEALELQSLKPWFDRHGDTAPLLVNMYGITETTVHVTYRPLSARDLGSGSVIGRPIPDLQVYILDAQQRPVPVGVPGEMYVGGAGVARGYLNRAELTAARFIQNPFENGTRLYRTGDLARYLPDGDIEYLGRIDLQVKIRGFRIELGEIESVLIQHEAVEQCAVVAREDSESGKRLVGYVVGKPGAALDVTSIRAHLKTKLPDYMVPAAVVIIDRLPLTQNGKLDVRALPAPEPARPKLATDFAAPETPAQATLAEIWQKTLRLERVGIHDNFFELGGDSILCIHIVAKARQAGFAITPKDLFDHPTIAELAEAASERQMEQAVAAEPVEADVPLSPIQQWFFAHQFEHPAYWNQAFLFSLPAELDPPALAAASRALARHHDAFRLRFKHTPDGWKQFYGSAVGAIASETIDLPDPSPERLQQACIEAQQGLDFAHGPIARIVQFRRPADAGHRLLIAVHHLVIDGVSWRILLEDLESAYRQAANGATQIMLPARTTAFRQWSESLKKLGESGRLSSITPANIDVHGRLPTDGTGPNSERDATTHVLRLDRENTSQLLSRSSARDRSGIDALLLTALGNALRNWTGRTTHIVEVEGHGREVSVVAELSGETAHDLSRTIGWFTVIYAVELTADGDLSAALAANQRALDAVPNRGLSPAFPGQGPGADVLFNYLGQLDQLVSGLEHLRFAPESTGPWHSPNCHRTHLLEINCAVIDGQFEARWTYSRNRHGEATIAKVGADFIAALRQLIESSKSRASAPERLTLSPIQQLYFSLEQARPNSGFEQWYCDIAGELDVARFQQAWKRVLDRHEVLRTTFSVTEVGPSQWVHGSADPQWRVEDWQVRTDSERAELFKAFLAEDRARGLNVAELPLMRFALLQIAPDRWRFVWSHHHLQIDGWSWPIVFAEVARLYRDEQLQDPLPYRGYLEWLAQQDRTQTERFWRDQLRGFKRSTLVGPTLGAACAGEAEVTAALAADATAALVSYARETRVTLSAVVQSAWALVIGKLAESSDVVFGATFSGRPAAIPGIEGMVGPCVNNLPIRVRLEANQPAGAVATAIHAQAAAMTDHQFVPADVIQGWSELPWNEGLFDNLVVFQNYLVDEELFRLQGNVRLENMVSPVRTAFPVTIVANPGTELKITAIAADEDLASQIAGTIVSILEAMARDRSATISTLQGLVPASLRRSQTAPRSRKITGSGPRDAMQQRIAEIWREALRVDEVGVDENFFDLGGNSLLLIRMHARLREVMSMDFPIVKLFQHPTIATLAAYLGSRRTSAETEPAQSATSSGRSRGEMQKAALAARAMAARRR